MQINSLFYRIILLIMCNLQIIQAQNWIQQSSNTNADLYAVWFADSLKGWICGENGIILYTNDGGQNWLPQNSGVSVALEDIFFWDEQTGWIVGDSGTVLKTMNGGLQWEIQSTTVQSRLLHIRFSTDQTGYATGEHNTSISTTDGGNTWIASSTSDSGSTSLITFWAGDMIGGTFISSDSFSAKQFHTIDGGITWIPTAIYNYPIYDVSGSVGQYLNFTSDFYWSVGEGGNINWTIILRPSGSGVIYACVTGDTLDLEAITLEPSEEGFKLWAVGEKSWIITSIDSGLTWVTNQINSDVDLHDIFFPKKNVGWAVGDSGMVLNYNIVTSIEPHFDHQTSKYFSYGELYPNPFNNTVNIEFLLFQSGEISLTIYNTLGQLVKTLYYGFREKGKYHHQWDGTNEYGENIASGLYLIHLTMNNFTSTKKLLFLK